MATPFLTANDYERSCTSFSVPVVTAVLHDSLDGRSPSRILDVGCGYGGVVARLGSR